MYEDENVKKEDSITIENEASLIRSQVTLLEQRLVALFNHRDFNNEDFRLNGSNIPETRNANIKANITLAFRALEDSRMRLGKVMQACQGGISIFDKQEKEMQKI